MKKRKLTVICPVCGEHTFAASDDHAKCPVCGWINDAFQSEHKFAGRGVNRLSLAQQQKAWKILNLEYEVGYGIDNLLWGTGVGNCNLCKDKICPDECYYHVERLLEGKLPAGCTDLTEAQKICARCIMNTHTDLQDSLFGKMAAKYSDNDTYGNGQWGVGPTEYDIDYYQKMLKSLVNFCHQENEKKAAAPKTKNNDIDFAANKDMLLETMASDDTGRRNFESYYCRTLLSIADFIRYACNDEGVLDHKFSLWAFGETDDDEKYKFTTEERQNAAQVLHLTLSFWNYRCDQFGLPGLYYLDNAYKGWDVDEFNDTISAWFVDIGDELNEQFIKDSIIDTLQQSFAYSHVKLALHMLHYLGYAKTDKRLQELVKLYCKAPSLAELAKSCM